MMITRNLHQSRTTTNDWMFAVLVFYDLNLWSAAWKSWVRSFLQIFDKSSLQPVWAMWYPNLGLYPNGANSFGSLVVVLSVIFSGRMDVFVCINWPAYVPQRFVRTQKLKGTLHPILSVFLTAWGDSAEALKPEAVRVAPWGLVLW